MQKKIVYFASIVIAGLLLVGCNQKPKLETQPVPSQGPAGNEEYVVTSVPTAVVTESPIGINSSDQVLDKEKMRQLENQDY